ncbi:uncharacterized protein N7482_005104 [Penicillium canariense]|uniref:Uncharacterized protein n=1 Tax=Penicillium canariense TaxID=189055 RepID=A0A9W9I3X2_9EURO|nr:uncharacterized protein N7482_005104 [Penicillium canariense]KAJ5166323.1 hypothetical protein N7482_005104 [Penicillium canariense]
MAPRKGIDSPVTRSRDRVLPGGPGPGPGPGPNARIAKPARSKFKPKRPPGRPFKMPARSGSSQSQSQSRSASSSQPSAAPSAALTPAPRALSMLEALPVEVLEQIFLYSLNLNLPRASPVIAAAVSREQIYSLLIILAFWDDPPTHRRSDAMNRILTPLDYVPLTLDQRGQLQEAVLRCRWCTMARVREQIPTIMILTIHRQWINMGITMEPAQQAALDRFMQRQDDTIRTFHGQGPPLTRAAQLCQHPEMLRLSRIPGPHDYELHITPMVLVELRARTMKSIVAWPALSLIKFPDHLLRGRRTGFTPDDVMYLEMLRMCSNNYTHIDSPLIPSTTTTVNRTALHEGVGKAIRTQNYNALLSLLKIDEYIFRFNAVNQARPVFYTIPSDHFLTVTRVGRDKPHLNAAFMEALIRASAESIPPNAPEILEWTLENVRLTQRHPSSYNDINGKLAHWLSNFVLRLPEQLDYTSEFPQGQLFTCGQLDPLDLEACRFIEEVLEPWRGPPPNYMPESQFRTEDWWVEKSGLSKK